MDPALSATQLLQESLPGPGDCRASFIFIIAGSCTFPPGCVGMCITMETLEVKSLKCWQAEFLFGA